MLARLFLIAMCGELWCYMHEAPEGTLYYLVGGGIIMTLGDIIIDRCMRSN